MEFKKIGAQKYRNKAKYKDKSKIKDNKISHNVNESEDLETTVLQNNWYRYQSRDEHESVDASRDFSVLSKAPINQGYFEFKSDKYILEDGSRFLEKNELFDLDLNLLNESVGTIPFNEFCNIEDRFFTKEQIEEMKAKSEAAFVKYEELVKSEKYSNKQNTDPLPEKTIESFDDLSVSEPIEACMAEKFKIESCSKVETKDNTPVIKEDTKADESEDLEQWLDDILDD